MLAPGTCKVLMIYPRFAADTFWNLQRPRDFRRQISGAAAGHDNARRAVTEFLVAAAGQPQHRAMDGRTSTGPIWSAGGMLPQQTDTLDIIDLCRARGKPVVVGGPGVDSSRRTSIGRRISACSAKPRISSADFIEAVCGAGARKGCSRRRRSRPT